VSPAPGGAGRTGLRDWLIRFLFGSTAIQSFDGLVQRAARYQQFGADGMAATWLPRLWAATIDVIWYAGLLGIQRYGGRDWLSWVAFVVAFGASFGFQVFGAKDLPVAAVPPVALLLVLIVMHAPRRLQVDAEPEASVDATPPSRSPGAEPTTASAAAEQGASGNVPAPTPAVDRRALPARSSVSAGAHPAGRERAADAGSPTVPAREARAGTAPADPDQMMRAHWAAERSRGRTPSGAELDRVVGRNPDNGAGRKARSRYLREEAEGRFAASTSSVPGPAPASIPAGPVPAGTTAVRAPAGNAGRLPAAPRRAWPAGPATTPAGNGDTARPVVLGPFPARYQDRERSDA
jgi:hypothetical protein